MKNRTIAKASIALLAASALALAGCSKAADDKADSGDKATTQSSSTKATTSAKSTTAEDAVPTDVNVLTAENFHLHDGFVKAVPADKGMTAVFGMLENHTSKPAHLVGFTTSLGNKMNQIHEVVDGVMMEKKDGIVVPAEGHVMLQPGGDHLMIMGLDKAVEAGSTIDVTLVFEDGSEVEIKDIPARQIGAGDENYEDMDHSKMDHSKMNMDDMKDKMGDMKDDAKAGMDDMKKDAEKMTDNMKDDMKKSDDQ